MSQRFAHSCGILDPEKAKSQRIHLYGCGGIGSFTALALAKMGFDHLLLYDMDEVEPHNIDNQLYGPEWIGRQKTYALSTILRQLADVKPLFANGDLLQRQVSLDVYSTDIIIFALDSIELRKKLFEQLRYTPFALLIDARMGAEVIEIHAINPISFEEQRWYQETLFPPSEAAQVKCTEKNIMYTPFICGGLVANIVKRFTMNQKFPRTKVFDCQQMQTI